MTPLARARKGTFWRSSLDISRSKSVRDPHVWNQRQCGPVCLNTSRSRSVSSPILSQASNSACSQSQTKMAFSRSEVPRNPVPCIPANRRVIHVTASFVNFSHWSIRSIALLLGLLFGPDTSRLTWASCHRTPCATLDPSPTVRAPPRPGPRARSPRRTRRSYGAVRPWACRAPTSPSAAAW